MYLEFFESKGHLAMKSFSLVPHNDNSLLLINAGMAPLKPYFTGQEVPPRTRVTTCQKCIRTGDIEIVGKIIAHQWAMIGLAIFLYERRSTTRSSIPLTPRSSQRADFVCMSLPVRCAWSWSSISPLMPMWRGSLVKSTSTTSCSTNLWKIKEAYLKAYLRYLPSIWKCVTIWQDDNAFCLQSYVSGVSGQSLRCCCKRIEVQ